MYKIVRAAGFAAAAFGAAFSPALADPSQMLDLAPSQNSIPYSAHAASAVTASKDAEPLVAETPAFAAPSTEAPIAEHAVSSILPEPVVVQQEEKNPKRSLLSLVDEYASASASDANLHCLAGAIYFESKGEPLAGQLAVAEVIINRSKSGRYPSTMCGVVKQRGQFSFVRGGRLPPIPMQSPHWRKAVAIAHIALKDLADSPAENALAFHATYVSPRWRMKRVATVGNHIFYR